jgi:hypothetical protein
MKLKKSFTVGRFRRADLTTLKNVLLAGVIVATSTIAVAHATPIAGTFDITVYQGPGNGSLGDPNNQAQQSNPLISLAHELGAGAYTGNIDFNAAVNTIGNFFSSGGGTQSPGLLALAGDILSTGGFGTTSVFVIKGNTGGATLGGFFDHDDGGSLYDGIGFGTLVAGSPSPTTDMPTAFSGLIGPWEMIYVEANGLPAILDMEVTSVPEPASLTLLGAVLLGFGLLKRRRKRS